MPLGNESCYVEGMALRVHNPFARPDGRAPEKVEGSLVGSRLGDYLFLDEIGSGGMSRIFKARHLGADEIRAIKLLRPELVPRADCRARLRLEGRVLRSVRHRHVVGFHEVQLLRDGLVLISMEFLEGETLRQCLCRKSWLPPADAVDIARQVAAGMEAVHRNGILHRDLSPDNIFLVSSEGERLAKVIDFGIASHSAEPESMELVGSNPRGKRDYAPPEQWHPPQPAGPNGSEREEAFCLDFRADIYSLGVSLYETLTGVRPFASEELERFLRDGTGTPRSMRATNPVTSVPAELEDLILTMLSADREQRPPTMSAILAALENL